MSIQLQTLPTWVGSSVLRKTARKISSVSCIAVEVRNKMNYDTAPK